jgi:MFS family permease
VGSLFARWGARRTMLTGAALLGLTSLAYASLVDLWMLYAIMPVAGFAVTSSTVLPAQTLVTNWFDKFRGRAMGLMMLGIGAGAFLLPPLNAFLIELIGWRYTWVVSFGVLALIVIPLIAAFVRTRPSDLGQSPDGIGSSEAGGDESGPAGGLSAKAALATATFWLLVAVFLLQLPESRRSTSTSSPSPARRSSSRTSKLQSSTGWRWDSPCSAVSCLACWRIVGPRSC